jgi:DNA-binding transcriptional LysR family regulator
MQLSDRIGRRMKLHDLHVLMAVVQAGSMGKAAKLLSTTQPAVSRSITDLEHTIGVRLLDRSSRGVVPTEYGRALLDGGTAMFDDLRQAIRRIEHLTDPATGEVRVSSYDPHNVGLLPAVFDRLRRKHPGIAVHVNPTVAGAQQFDDLRERKVDLFLGRIQYVEDDIDVERLFHDRIVVVAGPNNQFARRRNVELSELANEPWMLPPRDSTIGRLVGEAFRAHGVSFPPKGVIWGVASIACATVPRGPFLAVLPNSLLRFGVNFPHLSVIPVDLTIDLPMVGIMTLKNRMHTPAVTTFIDCVRTVTRPLAMNTGIRRS